VGCRGTLWGKGTWRVARLLLTALGCTRARGRWEERHIGGAESARGALRCGQRRGGGIDTGSGKRGLIAEQLWGRRQQVAQAGYLTTLRSA